RPLLPGGCGESRAVRASRLGAVLLPATGPLGDALLLARTRGGARRAGGRAALGAVGPGCGAARCSAAQAATPPAGGPAPTRALALLRWADAANRRALRC